MTERGTRAISRTIQPSPETARAIRELFAVTQRLSELHPGRHFTPDGHTVGSLGEVAAAEHYGLKLYEASHRQHDAYELVDGKKAARSRSKPPSASAWPSTRNPTF